MDVADPQNFLAAPQLENVLSGVQGGSSEVLCGTFKMTKPIVKNIPIKPANIVKIYDTIQ